MQLSHQNDTFVASFTISGPLLPAEQYLLSLSHCVLLGGDLTRRPPHPPAGPSLDATPPFGSQQKRVLYSLSFCPVQRSPLFFSIIKNNNAILMSTIQEAMESPNLLELLPPAERSIHHAFLKLLPLLMIIWTTPAYVMSLWHNYGASLFACEQLVRTLFYYPNLCLSGIVAQELQRA